MIVRADADLSYVSFFFFQAEDGIRDYKVTGVQTCALPICRDLVEQHAVGVDQELVGLARHARRDVGEDQVVPAEVGDQPVGGGQLDAGLPFLGRHLAADLGHRGVVAHGVYLLVDIVWRKHPPVQRPVAYWSRSSRLSTLPMALRGSSAMKRRSARRWVLPARWLYQPMMSSGRAGCPARDTT